MAATSLKVTMVGLASLVFAFSAARVQANSEQSYPYDPACPWGRVGDGKGMLVRCLTQAEATQLAALPARAAAPSKAQPGASAPAAAESPNAASDTEPGEAGAAEPALEEPVPELTVVVDRVQADKGAFPQAKLDTANAKERYLSCVDKNGGVSRAPAEVVVRFLVRERGRAEGVSVKSFKGVNAKAAKCVAEVVDRRPVGTPEGPLVGASLRIEFQMKAPAPARR